MYGEEAIVTGQGRTLGILFAIVLIVGTILVLAVAYNKNKEIAKDDKEKWQARLIILVPIIALLAGTIVAALVNSTQSTQSSHGTNNDTSSSVERCQSEAVGLNEAMACLETDSSDRLFEDKSFAADEMIRTIVVLIVIIGFIPCWIIGYKKYIAIGSSEYDEDDDLDLINTIKDKTFGKVEFYRDNSTVDKYKINRGSNYVVVIMPKNATYEEAHRIYSDRRKKWQ